MGEISPPTAADYASDAAQSAKNEVKRLAETVTQLERRIESIENRMSGDGRSRDVVAEFRKSERNPDAPG